MRSSAPFAALLLLAGCYADHAGPADAGPGADRGPDVEVEVSLTDTLGWSLAFTYSRFGPAHGEGARPHPIDCREDEASHAAFDWNGRLLVIQARCENTIYEIQPRPVVCETASDCEPVLAYLQAEFEPDEVPARTECLRGLCQFPEQPISRQDIYAMCLWDTPRWRDFWGSRSEESGYPELRTLVAEHCFDGACTWPESCREP